MQNIKITDNGDKSDISLKKMKQWRWWDEGVTVPSVHTDTGHKGAVSHATEVIDLLDWSKMVSLV